MNDQKLLNYQRIAKAIEYIVLNFKNQPDLTEIAEKVHISPYHFQRLFLEWAGTTPKRFVQYLSIEHAKHLLRKEQFSVFDTAYQAGLSGTGRLHDLFVKIEGMSPAEYKNGAKSLNINYSIGQSLFGQILVASTERGICHLAFIEDLEQALTDLYQKFPQANFSQHSDDLQQSVINFFENDWANLPEIKLHLKGTPFQLKVWEMLIKIPMGHLVSYGQMAEQIGHPKASRAVGTAIGSNPVAFLIPCHRVIQASGHLGGYMWGPTRKYAIIGWENAKTEVNKEF